MWYHYSLEVTANTPESTPIEKELNLTYGVIKYIGIGFPSGTKQVVKVRLYRFEHQIFPTNSDEPACWDGGIEGGEEHYPLLEAPYNLLARGYSPGSSHDHIITILINVLPVEVAEPWRVQKAEVEKVSTALERIKRLFGLR